MLLMSSTREPSSTFCTFDTVIFIFASRASIPKNPFFGISMISYATSWSASALFTVGYRSITSSTVFAVIMYVSLICYPVFPPVFYRNRCFSPRRNPFSSFFIGAGSVLLRMRFRRPFLGHVLYLFFRFQARQALPCAFDVFLVVDVGAGCGRTFVFLCLFLLLSLAQSAACLSASL